MPRLVDHDERRQAIIAAAWRLIGASGIDGVNMRDLAAEAGYANGALSRYFDGKDAILQSAFEYILHATNTRIDESAPGARGLDAVRKVCHEIMPLTEVTRLEARIAVSLWQRALTDPAMECLNTTAVAQWTSRIEGHLVEAIEDGEVRPIDAAVYADVLMTMMNGLQVTAALEPTRVTRRAQLALLDSALGVIRVAD